MKYAFNKLENIDFLYGLGLSILSVIIFLSIMEFNNKLFSFIFGMLMSIMWLSIINNKRQSKGGMYNG